MKLSYIKNILNEEELKITDYFKDETAYHNFNFFVEEIKHNCQKILKFYQQNNCYRLIRGCDYKKPIFFLRKKYFEPRKPKDTKKSIDDFLEYYREKYFSQVPSRKHSLFCLFYHLDNVKDPVKFNGQNYGRPYIIYPSDDFKLFQSKYIKDFFESNVYYDIEDLIKSSWQDFYQLDLVMSPEIRNNLNKYFINSYDDNDLSRMFSKNQEIVIEANKVYHLDYTNNFLLNKFLYNKE